MRLRSSSNLLRAERDGKVAFVEIFFDLVFVFAITQLAQGWLRHFTPLGTVQSAFLMLAVWWVWVYSTWALNWLDPGRMPVRLMLYALMLLGLFMSMSIPEAFGVRGLSFALAFAAAQVGRSLFAIWAAAGTAPVLAENFRRIACWMLISAVFWIAGGLAGGSMRMLLWGMALGIEFLGPLAGFYVPGRGRSTRLSWTVNGAHMAERCGLFVIICLGETLLVSGATFAGMEWSGLGIAVFLTGFATIVIMWWIYFNIGHDRAAQLIATSGDPRRIARIAYAFAHFPIIAGIVLSAVADALVLARPTGPIGNGTAAVIIGGPALFVIGNLWFRALTAPLAPLSHMAGLTMMLGLCFGLAYFSPLGLALAVTAILLLIAVWEQLSAGRAPAP